MKTGPKFDTKKIDVFDRSVQWQKLYLRSQGGVAVPAGATPTPITPNVRSILCTNSISSRSRYPPLFSIGAQVNCGPLKICPCRSEIRSVTSAAKTLPAAKLCQQGGGDTDSDHAERRGVYITDSIYINLGRRLVQSSKSIGRQR